MSEPTPPAEPSPEPGDAPDPGRRRLLAMATLGLGACAGAALLGTVGVAVVGTPLAAEAGGEAGWYDLGPLERFAPGTARKVAVIGERRDAWNRFAARSLGRVVVVRPDASEAAQVFSAVCPHNGCDVRVDAEELVCPCHDSRFARDGSLLEGESPRGLDPLEARVDDGRLIVRLVRYQVGTAERRPL